MTTLDRHDELEARMRSWMHADVAAPPSPALRERLLAIPSAPTARRSWFASPVIAVATVIVAAVLTVAALGLLGNGRSGPPGPPPDCRTDPEGALRYAFDDLRRAEGYRWVEEEQMWTLVPPISAEDPRFGWTGYRSEGAYLAPDRMRVARTNGSEVGVGGPAGFEEVIHIGATTWGYSPGGVVIEGEPLAYDWQELPVSLAANRVAATFEHALTSDAAMLPASLTEDLPGSGGCEVVRELRFPLPSGVPADESRTVVGARIGEDGRLVSAAFERVRLDANDEERHGDLRVRFSVTWEVPNPSEFSPPDGPVYTYPPASADPSETSSPAAPDPVGEASDVASLFLDRMRDPEVTFRSEGRLQIHRPAQEGSPLLTVTTRYDIAGEDHAGWVSLRGPALDDPNDAMDLKVYAVRGWTYVQRSNEIDWSDVPSPEAARPANPFAMLEERDLRFVGMTADRFYEFEILPFVLHDPIGEWPAIGAVGMEGLDTAAVHAHRSRVIVGVDGVPHRFTSSWRFAFGDGAELAEGTFVDEYSAMGLFVSIAAPRDGFADPITSHDLIVGVDADRTIITQPFFEVVPDDGETADLEVTFEPPEEPVLLGIEGAIGFVQAEGADGSIILDRMVSLSESSQILVPAGQYDLTLAYRTCSGSCQVLDPPSDFCVVEADFDVDSGYRLVVSILDRDRADCTLTRAPRG